MGCPISLFKVQMALLVLGVSGSVRKAVLMHLAHKHQAVGWPF